MISNIPNSDFIYNKKANGKLLLTSEYYIIEGAEGIALPTKLGQRLIVENSLNFNWSAFDQNNKKWLSITKEDLYTNKNLNKTFDFIAKDIDKISFNYSFKLFLDFEREWGLGSSSTFCSLIADFYKVNPYLLNNYIFGGSGYDIACAFQNNPILYNKLPEPNFSPVSISSSITKHLYFVYSGSKQNTKQSISSNFIKSQIKDYSSISQLTDISKELLLKQEFNSWKNLIEIHDQIISKNLQLKKIKDTFAKDIPYYCKSLGAWGGDFFLCLSDDDLQTTKQVLNKYGFNTIFSFNDLILST